MTATLFTALLATLLAVLPAPRAAAQRVGTVALPFVTGETAERRRLGELVGDSAGPFTLLRAASRQLDTKARGWSVGIVMPEARVVRNSGLPFSFNESAMWAGRGTNTAVTGGVFLEAGPVRLIAAPTLVSEQNLAFQVIPYPQNSTPPRSVWANPFHPLPESIDWPLRFGDRPVRRLDAGKSSLTIGAGGLAAGVATENLWWGPAIRNAITLSNNAPGFPHAFLQTARPVATAWGRFDGQWIVGQLRESPFFDLTTVNNRRSLSGLAVTWTPPGDTTLTVGTARVVIASETDGVSGSAAFNVLRSVGHPDTDTSHIETRWGDQIWSVFARSVFPAAGLEAYVEWARFEEPLSLRDFLEYPGHSEGYTLGLQWARRLSPARTVQLQTEATYLEPDPSLRLRPVATTYTSRAVPQGFTHQGRTLGAAIGPGGSSQWLAGDVFADRWRYGVYLERIRWDNGVAFEPIVPLPKEPDVTLRAGVRGSIVWRGTRLALDVAHAARFNYLYQVYVFEPGHTGGIDLLNNTLAVTVSTGVGRRDRHE